MDYAVMVEVTLRPGIADPQGSTIQRALPTLGFDGVAKVTVGKAMRFSIEASTEKAAREQIDQMCTQFLTNPVIEQHTITIVDANDVVRVP